jgi:hypothetical protein
LEATCQNKNELRDVPKLTVNFHSGILDVGKCIFGGEMSVVSVKMRVFGQRLGFSFLLSTKDFHPWSRHPKQDKVQIGVA